MKTRPSFAPALRRLLTLAILLCTAATVAAEPEITVTIDNTNILDGGTYHFGTTDIGSRVAKTVRIRNTGTGTKALSGIAITKAGSHPGNFINTAPGTSIPAGGSTTFNVDFVPSALGERSATFAIANNDADENPFNVTLTGTAVALPEIVITQGGTNMVDGNSTVNFGKVTPGTTAARQFTIRNAGSATLTGLVATLSGSGAYTKGSLGATSLGPGQVATLTVSFAPGFQTTYTSTLRISSNDADESPFDIALTGTGFVAVMSVALQGRTLYDGADLVTFAGTTGIPVRRTFTIRPVNSNYLSGLNVTMDGPGVADFSVTPLPGTTLAPDSEMSFTVTFVPPAVGDFSAVLQISADQTPGDPFDIALLGSGVTLSPEADDDGDGTANMLETATGSDPLEPGPPPGVLIRNGSNLEFVYDRLVAVQGELSLSVEWADDPTGPWTVVDSAPVLENNDPVLQRLRVVFPAGNTGKRFARLRATKL